MNLPGNRRETFSFDCDCLRTRLLFVFAVRQEKELDLVTRLIQLLIKLQKKWKAAENQSGSIQVRLLCFCSKLGLELFEVTLSLD
jgi:hypothetical protein